jgi:hypothetical protein
MDLGSVRSGRQRSREYGWELVMSDCDCGYVRAVTWDLTSRTAMTTDLDLTAYQNWISLYIDTTNPNFFFSVLTRVLPLSLIDDVCCVRLGGKGRKCVLCVPTVKLRNVSKGLQKPL